MDHLDKVTFWTAFGAAEITGIVLVILMGYWTGVTRGGFAWQEDPGKQFNWHPLLITLGLIYFYGNGMMLYRVFRDGQKKKLKILHAIIMMVSFVLMVIALKAAFDSHDYKKPPIPNMYSLHSWMGIITALLFTMQWVAGFVMFLAPTNIASRLKAIYLSIHTWFGSFIFVLACATALVGVTEKMLFTTIFSPAPYKGFYQRLESEGVMMNTASLLIILFGALVVFLSTNVKFKRLPLPEEVALADGNKGQEQEKDA